ncbi:MAG TPA: hypothetical protein VKF14_18890 [Candidatus Dormibacteraeota bacterium]|nr:hypothetical protein [Candidatus Dormibacteraeota bacterium]
MTTTLRVLRLGEHLLHAARRSLSELGEDLRIAQRILWALGDNKLRSRVWGLTRKEVVEPAINSAPSGASAVIRTL